MFRDLLSSFQRAIIQPNIEKVPRVLIVDDDYESGAVTEIYFRKLGWNTEVAIDFDDAVRRIVDGEYDLIVLDWLLNGYSGGEVLQRAAEWAEADVNFRHRILSRRPWVMVVSGLAEDRYEVPLTPYFKFLKSEQKPITMVSGY